MTRAKLEVWSCGGGTQSCAIGALIVQGRLPKPDVCLIADTGRETGATWEYLDQTLNPALVSVGLEVIRIPAETWGRHGTRLCYSETVCAIPAFSTLNGPIAKLTNFCTTNWKIDVQRRWLSEVLGMTKSRCRQWIGFSRDEQRRVSKAMIHEDHRKGLTWLPLVEGIPTTRREAVQLVERMGWPTPPRSACWMCPNHSDHEWRKLREERPQEFASAVALESELRAVDPDIWLHRSAVPLGHVDFTRPADLFSRPCDSGHCFV
jgi:hypothetical protein